MPQGLLFDRYLLCSALRCAAQIPGREFGGAEFSLCSMNRALFRNVYPGIFLKSFVLSLPFHKSTPTFLPIS